MDSPQSRPFVFYMLIPGVGVGATLWLLIDAFVERGKEYGIVPSNFPAPLTGPVWWVWALVMLMAGLVIMMVIEAIREQ